jgi:hypothetical protein
MTFDECSAKYVIDLVTYNLDDNNTCRGVVLEKNDDPLYPSVIGQQWTIAADVLDTILEINTVPLIKKHIDRLLQETPSGKKFTSNVSRKSFNNPIYVVANMMDTIELYHEFISGGGFCPSIFSLILCDKWVNCWLSKRK